MEHMRIVVPYVGEPHPDTRAALAEQAPEPGRVEYIDVGGSPTAYYELFVALWQAGQSFILIEHDIVIAPGTIDAFESCTQSWCSVSRGVGRDGRPLNLLSMHRLYRWQVGQLQCNRFRSDMMVGQANTCRLSVGLQHWGNFGKKLLIRLESRGQRPHIHWDLPTNHPSGRTPEEHARREDERIRWFHDHLPPNAIERHLPVPRTPFATADNLIDHRGRFA
jgi:hypothetical protein